MAAFHYALSDWACTVGALWALYRSLSRLPWLGLLIPLALLQLGNGPENYQNNAQGETKRARRAPEVL